MQEASSFYIDSKRVVSETLEGETIIIDFQSGTYYSLNETATDIWKSLLAGLQHPALLERMGTIYETVPQDALDTFLSRLQEEHLIEVGTPTQTTPLAPHEGAKRAFVTPELKAFRDMQEMLLADPIHDIDATGWPNLKKA